MSKRISLASRFTMIVLLSAIVPAHAAGNVAAVSYTTTIAGSDGSHAVRFEGTAVGSSLSGTLTIDGESRSVSGTIANDGSVSGQLSSADGKRLGTFWGQRVGTSLKGSFDLGGQVGDWSVPASKLPIPIPTATGDGVVPTQ